MVPLPILSLWLVAILTALTVHASREVYSGIYPHLAFFNEEDECGTGAVVPWAGRLWAVTYAPHKPAGSTDKLYEITHDLELIVRPESIGGTPANRMIHRESNQLFIGPYAIDAERRVRAIPYAKMYGRPTANARHLTDPVHKIYYASMEEAFYEVDVSTLEVTTLYVDEQLEGEPKANLPGYHGKGLYSGQGRLVYANNGDKDPATHRNPFVPSGALAQWDRTDWEVILRKQFTEVTGPGGIDGSENPATDPIWSIGWDVKSLILMVLDEGEWHAFRLPKASHSYDGSHGWNTEWPRIRDVGEESLLMTMHGTFWNFPRSFSASQRAGLTPRSNYLKVVGDFARWGDRIVLGCDDTARNEFLNTRRAKGKIAAPQSQSNLWFLEPAKLDNLGPAIGRGAVWLNEPVAANRPSEPFLVEGFDTRSIHFSTDTATTLTIEVDPHGDGRWIELTTLNLDGYRWFAFPATLTASWARVRSSEALTNATAWFNLSKQDPRRMLPTPSKFAGIATSEDRDAVGGLIRAHSDGSRTLQFAARGAEGRLGYYTLNGDMELTASDETDTWDWMQEHAGIPPREGVVSVDAASVLYVDDRGNRWRLPNNPRNTQPGPLGFGRLCREVATERDLFNCQGTFYELPAKNAGGFQRVRPVSSHNLEINDYCSYRGLFVISGIHLQTAGDNHHIIKSADGQAALWVGAIDDIWELGKAIGEGGPWKDTPVVAGEPSDPYLMTGYDKKSLTLESSKTAIVTAEVDISGMGDWKPYRTFRVEPGKAVHFQFPDAFRAYWIRFVSDQTIKATAQLHYR